jgi:hypothetical protein
MIRVKGTDFKTVELPDLGDRIFFGQTKSYSENAFSSSRDLAEAIKNNRVAVVSGTEPPPSLYLSKKKEVTEISIPVEPSKVEEPPKVEVVPVPAPEVSSAVLDKITDVLGEIQNTLKTQREDTTKAIQENTTRVEKAMAGLTISGVNVSSPVRSTHTRVEEVFVPSTLTVTDMTNHVNLKTQEIGQGDSVRNSLNKLKKLKNQPAQG